jgi:hypothetical protein
MVKTPSEHFKYIYKQLNDIKNKGKVLDVSNLTQKGTGSRIIEKPSSKSLVVKVGRSKLYSNNYQSYELATKLLGTRYLSWSKMFKDVHGCGKVMRKEKSNNVVRRVRSYEHKIEKEKHNKYAIHRNRPLTPEAVSSFRDRRSHLIPKDM